MSETHGRVRRAGADGPIVCRIDDDAWVDIDDYIGARAQVAETVYNQRRLVARRTLNQGTQPTLIEDWRHHAFVTSLDGDLLVVDRTDRAHAVVELASGI